MALLACPAAAPAAGATTGALAGEASRPDGNAWSTRSAFASQYAPPKAKLELRDEDDDDDDEGRKVLQATITAQSQATTYRVEYGPTERYGSKSSEWSAGSDDDPVDRIVFLPLERGKHYHLRAVATNASGSGASQDLALAVTASGDLVGLPRHSHPAPPAATAPVAPAPDPSSQTPLPTAKPVLGTSVVIRPLSGSVRYKPRGASAFAPLAADVTLPVGSLVDTRRGRVSLKSARNRRGRTQTGSFRGSVFQVRQRRRNGGITDIVLRGGRFSRCGAVAGASALAHEAAGKRRVVRRLWGKDRHGRFRTHGRDSVATVRGTEWVTTDRCDGTLTKVSEGKVLVRDLRRKRSVLLTAGRAYLARHARR